MDNNQGSVPARMMPRFVRFGAGNRLSSQPVVLMKAKDHDPDEAMYVTQGLEGYYMLHRRDLETALPVDEGDLDWFITAAVRTWRTTQPARELVRALASVRKALDRAEHPEPEPVGLDDLAETTVRQEAP